MFKELIRLSDSVSIISIHFSIITNICVLSLNARKGIDIFIQSHHVYTSTMAINHQV